MIVVTIYFYYASTFMIFRPSKPIFTNDILLYSPIHCPLILLYKTDCRYTAQPPKLIINLIIFIFTANVKMR